MERYEKILVLDNEVQAQLVDSVLSDRGIPHMMMSYRDSAYDGIFQGQKGWGHIEAPQQDRVEFIDVSSALLDAQGKPRSDYLSWDGLHPNRKCYDLMTSIIKPILLKRFPVEGRGMGCSKLLRRFHEHPTIPPSPGFIPAGVVLAAGRPGFRPFTR